MNYVRLEDLCVINSGGTPRRNNESYWKNGDIPWVKISDFKNGVVESTEEFITLVGLKNSSAKIFPQGTLLYTIFATIGEVAILKIDAATNQAIVGIQLKENQKVYLKYIYYYLKSQTDSIKQLGRGVAQNNINLSVVKNMIIPIVSLEKQSNIIATLNKLEKIKENQITILNYLDDLIKSRFVELIAKNKLIYQKVRLKDCCLISSGATPSRKNSDYWDENGINWFKTNELKNNFLFDSDEKISKLGYEKSSVKLLPKHTVLIAMYGQGKTRGMTGYLLNNATTNQACAALISLDIINPKYLWYTMINSYDRLRNMAKGGSQPNLSVSLIKDFEIILPPIDIQNKFTNSIEQINKLKSDVQKSINETQLLMDSLMQEYFS